MTTTKQADSATGPWTNLSTVCGGQFDNVMKAADPAIRAMGRLQLECMHLAMQRGRAWASFPAELAHCQSPADVARLQMQYWQTMNLNYAEGLHRLWHALAGLAPHPQVEDAAAIARDVIAVRPEAGASDKPRNRQAA